MMLGLTGRSAKEWDRFSLALKQGKVFLTDSPDELVWLFNSKEGKVVANMAYRSDILVQISFKIDGWMKCLWKGNLPLKKKLFSWRGRPRKMLSMQFKYGVDFSSVWRM